MQDIDNNMDDLFRKAVDNYTLQPGESNWDVIVSQLAEEDRVAVVTEINHKKNTAVNGVLLLMLLLIPLSTAMFSYYYSTGSTTKAGEKSVMFPHLRVQPEVYRTPTENKADYKESIARDITAKPWISDNATIPLHNVEINKNMQMGIPSDLIRTIKRSSRAPIHLSLSAGDSSSFTQEAATVNLEQQTNTVSNKKPVAPKTHALQKARIYAGIIAGVTFNEVKHQGFRKPGFDIGIMGGYNINKNIAVEAGVLYSKKNYFSDGKYFSMDKMGGSMPTEMKIMSLEGSSNLYQLPVVVKYNVAHINKSALFASAGISSYLLTKEKNDYQVSMNGVQQNMEGMYKQVSAGFASAADISVGYEHTLQKATIRIQPYLQIPLKGMGMGRMQVMSTGIHLVYTR